MTAPLATAAADRTWAARSASGKACRNIVSGMTLRSGTRVPVFDFQGKTKAVFAFYSQDRALAQIGNCLEHFDRLVFEKEIL
jgi:hypothetical protein